MLRALILKEWMQNLLELRFLVCAALCIFLAAVSVWVLREDLSVKRADFGNNRGIFTRSLAIGKYHIRFRSKDHANKE